jgi:hypothetical protein
VRKDRKETRVIGEARKRRGNGEGAIRYDDDPFKGEEQSSTIMTLFYRIKARHKAMVRQVDNGIFLRWQLDSTIGSFKAKVAESGHWLHRAQGLERIKMKCIVQEEYPMIRIKYWRCEGTSETGPKRVATTKHIVLFSKGSHLIKSGEEGSYCLPEDESLPSEPLLGRSLFSPPFALCRSDVRRKDDGVANICRHFFRHFGKLVDF